MERLEKRNEDWRDEDELEEGGRMRMPLGRQQRAKCVKPLTASTF